MAGLPLVAPAEWFPSPGAAQLFSVIYLAWLAAEVVNLLLGTRLSAFGQRRDRGSFLVIAATVGCGIVLAYGLRSAGLGLAAGWPQFVGMALMTVGIAIRQWAVGTLGRHFSTIVAARASHTLVTGGPYRWVRHPSYSGAIITLTGMPLGMGTWAGALAALAVALAGYLYRARVEETALIERFGEPYRDFAASRPRFFPGL
jgi:protein-S-isoprenylcysteine O-methyltransferase Ste14